MVTLLVPNVRRAMSHLREERGKANPFSPMRFYSMPFQDPVLTPFPHPLCDMTISEFVLANRAQHKRKRSESRVP